MHRNPVAAATAELRPALVQYSTAARREGAGHRGSTGEMKNMPELTQLVHGPQGEAKTVRIGIIICARYRDCGGGKCFRALRQRQGGFSRYAGEDQLQLVGYSSCGGCPGGNVESVPAEFLKNGADAVHLGDGLGGWLSA